VTSKVGKLISKTPASPPLKSKIRLGKNKQAKKKGNRIKDKNQREKKLYMNI
jgi:hypothetical protein